MLLKLRHPFQARLMAQTSGSWGFDLGQLSAEQRQIVRERKPSRRQLLELLREWGIDSSGH